MEGVLFLLLGGVGALVLLGVAVLYLRDLRRRETIRSLMGQRYQDETESFHQDSAASDGDAGELDAEVSQQVVGRRNRASKEPTLEERMFQAGLFSEEQRRDFLRLRIVLPIALCAVFAAGSLALGDPLYILLGAVVGLLLGSLIPLRLLDRWIAARNEDVLFYLPLVIEQISIGVSSSLDIGPCVARVVQMADERDSHNPVTELLRFAQAYIKSGVNLQDALNEVGRQSGNNEVKHAFKALAQVARYGGEISKQLQDLSESVTTERETQVEAKIKTLELRATGPVSLVFLGYLLILLVGFGMSVMKGISG